MPFLSCPHHDIVSPDRKIVELSRTSDRTLDVKVIIESISPSFFGFSIEKELVFFNLKNTLAQLGVEALTKGFELFERERRGELALELYLPFFRRNTPSFFSFYRCLCRKAFCGRSKAAGPKTVLPLSHVWQDRSKRASSPLPRRKRREPKLDH